MDSWKAPKQIKSESQISHDAENQTNRNDGDQMPGAVDPLIKSEMPNLHPPLPDPDPVVGLELEKTQDNASCSGVGGEA